MSPDEAPFIAKNKGPVLFPSTNDALKRIRQGLVIPHASYPVLRIFASYPGEAKLDLTLESEERTRRKGKNKSLNVYDTDPHPLATLHYANFKENSTKLSGNWFLGDTEQREAIYSQNPVGGESI